MRYIPHTTIENIFYSNFKAPENWLHPLLSINIFVWGVALCSHAACKNFAGLFVVRFLLGMCEGSITAGFMIVTSMFYTRKEQTVRVGYWCKWSKIFRWYVMLTNLFSVIHSSDERDRWELLPDYSHFLPINIRFIAQIIGSFIAFGTLHIKTGGFEPWQWLMIITGALTFIIAVAYWWANAVYMRSRNA